MAEKDKRYYWLRLKRDFFKRHDIQIIESMENGKDYILFYLKLLCESVDHEGNLRFSEQIPYNEKMLSTITNTNVDIVRRAIEIFSELGMMDVLDDGTIYMNEVQKMIGSETYWAERKRIQKAKTINSDFNHITVLSTEQIALPNGDTKFIDEKRYGGNGKAVWERAQCKCEICGSTDNLCIHHNNGYSNELEDLLLVCRSCHRKIEAGEIGKFPTQSNSIPTCPSKSKSIEIEKEKEIEKESEKEKRERINYQEIVDMYNDTCVSFPRLTSLSDARKKAIKARLKTHTVDEFQLMFEKAEASNFLKGANDRNWSATFDWMIKDSNMAKILDGNYDNKSGSKPNKVANHLEQSYEMMSQWAQED